MEMKVELEARYYGVNDGELMSSFVMNKFPVDRVSDMKSVRRIVWTLPGERKFLRVREVGTKAEISIKEIKDPATIDGTLEKTITIPGRHKLTELSELFQALGYGKGSYQESNRVIWRWLQEDKRGNPTIVCDLTFDYWPGLKPLLEVEVLQGGPEAIALIEKELKLPARFEGDIAALYEKEYGISRDELNSMERLTVLDFPRIPFK